MLTLYYTKGTCADVVLLMANTLEIELNISHVDISKKPPQTAHGKDYALINAKGYVPALALEDGEIITEVAAICAYFSTLKPGNTLFPLEGKTLVDQLQWFNYIATELHKNYMPLIYQAFGVDVGTKWPEIVKGMLTKRYQYVDQVLANQPYLTGNIMTAADIYCFMTTLWANKVSFDLSSFKNIQQFKARMQKETIINNLYPA